MTIITKKINGHGPYAYRVTYSGGRHHWEYLGPVDGDELPDDQAELDDEQFADAVGNGDAERIETHAVEFGDRATANETRDSLPDGVLAPADDRRSKTIKLHDEEASRAIKTRVEGRAADSRERETFQHGQEALTRAEKRDLDFSETNVFHARTAKAILQGEGVDDWLAYYDPTLRPSEHVDVDAFWIFAGIVAKRRPQSTPGRRDVHSLESGSNVEATLSLAVAASDEPPFVHRIGVETESVGGLNLPLLIVHLVAPGFDTVDSLDLDGELVVTFER